MEKAREIAKQLDELAKRAFVEGDKLKGLKDHTARTINAYLHDPKEEEWDQELRSLLEAPESKRAVSFIMRPTREFLVVLLQGDERFTEIFDALQKKKK